MLRTLCGLALLLGPSAALAETLVSFKKDVAPILVTRCLSCHNEKKAANKLDLSTFRTLRQGGKAQKAAILKPGDPDASYLVECLKPDAEPRMPFQLPPLKPAEIATIETWVKQGANFDAGSESQTRLATLVDPLANLPTVSARPGATEPVTSIAFSPSGMSIYAASGKNVVEYDAAKGTKGKAYVQSDALLTSVALSPDGSRLYAAGGRPGQFGLWAVWDVASGKLIETRKGHKDSILSLAISKDGKSLATASYDRLVLTWDTGSNKEPRPFREHTDSAYAVAFSPDGKLLATAGADRTLKLWDVASARRLVSFGDATGEVYALAFSPDGSTVVAAGVDRSIRSYAIKDNTASLARSVFAHEAPILKLVFSPDGKTLYSSSEDRTVRAWDLATLTPGKTFGPFTDWPQALGLSPSSGQLAVGLASGAIEVVNLADGSRRPVGVAPVTASAPAAPKPELVRPATLGPVSPRGFKLGSQTTVTLSGYGVGPTSRLLLDDPEITATPVPNQPNNLVVQLKVGPKARVGVHALFVQTSLGTPAGQLFAVTAYDEVAETPNAPAQVSKLPATLTGMIEAAGDTDEFAFDAAKGDSIVLDCLAKRVGSGLEPVLSLIDPQGIIVAQTTRSESGGDPTLSYAATESGRFKFRVADALLTGSGNHAYRVDVGHFPTLASAFPLGLRHGAVTEVEFTGTSIPGAASFTARSTPGTTIPLTRLPAVKAPVLTDRSLVIAEGDQLQEEKDVASPDVAPKVPSPGGFSGRIDEPGDADYIRFHGKKGETWIVEAYGRRLGSPVDTVIEVLDAKGNPIPRAILRRLFETQVAFRDHAALTKAIRLTQWDSLQVGDYLWGGRELLRIFALPKNPDDDAQFWGNATERVGQLETTPEHHPLAQPLEKVEILPPGSFVPTGGKPPIVLTYRNDDGGPNFGKDSRVTFVAAAEGEYLVRVEDVRNLGGPDFGYHLVIRKPQPSFQLFPGNESPNVPRGGHAAVPVVITRKDGFDLPVEVEAYDLPSGITSTATVIEPGMYTADLIFSADEQAPAVSPPTWKLRARSVDPERNSYGDWQLLDPGGPNGGLVTVIPPANLSIIASPSVVEIAPGQRVEMTFKVKRGPAFAGRVPIDVRNLPHGVRVLNIGLNGVLVTESQTERTVFLYAEPWAQPQERHFYASGKAESAGTAHASAPILLKVRRAAGVKAAQAP